MIRAVMFDLDGTLLPMDEEQFIRTYFHLLCRTAAPYGYEPEQLVKTLWAGTAAMVKNDGSVTNEEAFWKVFASIYGEEKRNSDRHVFEDFYRNEFSQAAETCPSVPEAKETVELCKKHGKRIILATNPIFPRDATMARIRWAGLDPNDFELVTTYENSCFSKPSADYYRTILERCGLKGEECLMAGNDAEEDMAASQAGIRVFIHTDFMINRKNVSLDGVPHGSWKELQEFLKDNF